MSEGVLAVARTAAEVDSLRPIWDVAGATGVDTDVDYFSTVVEVSPTADRPHVIHLATDDHDALLVARHARTPLRVWTGTVRPASLVVSFDGVLGARGTKDREHLLRALLVALRDTDTSAAIVQKVDIDSEWFQTLSAVPARRRAVRGAVPLWRTDLPDSYDALLAQRSTKSRRQLRFDDNKLRRTYGSRLTLRRLDDPEHHPRSTNDIMAVAEQSYQGKLGISLADDAIQQALLERAREAGWLRAWMLYVDERPVAFWWGVVRSGILSIGSPGFVPEHASDRVGYYTLRRMLEDACADPEICAIDWGAGHADYKERFGTSVRTVADVVLTADDPAGWALAGLLHAEKRSMAIARSTSARFELARRRRRRLVTRGTP